MSWRLVSGFVVTALLAVGMVVSTPGLASACSCVSENTAAHFDRADAVFIATDLTRSDDDGGLFGLGGSNTQATLTFQVSEVYKGRVSARQDVVTEGSGASCGMELSGDGPFAVFAENPTEESDLATDPGQYVGNLCGGSQDVAPEVRRALDAEAGGNAPTEPIAAPNDDTGSPIGWRIVGIGGFALLIGLAVVLVTRLRGRAG